MRPIDLGQGQLFQAGVPPITIRTVRSTVVVLWQACFVFKLNLQVKQFF